MSKIKSTINMDRIIVIVTICWYFCLIWMINDASAATNMTHLTSSSHQRQHRSVPEFEATLNAMKCALRIVGLQVSEHHNNMLMCCGLWKMKAFMKETADQVCENAHESKRVFDDFMTDELIYGKFTHSILGDDTLSCKKYPEGSATCERLFALITFILVLFILFIFILLVSCCMASFCWYKSRRLYKHLLQIKLSDMNSSEKEYFLRDHHHHHLYHSDNQNRKHWATKFKVLIPCQQLKSKSDNHQIMVVDRSSPTDAASGKSSPDSAVPPSTNSTTTSRNTSTMTLNDHPAATTATTIQNKSK